MSENILIKFSKMHGLGNDYVIINESKRVIIPEKNKLMVVKELCTRGFSVGADGVIFVTPSYKADIKFRIFNSDGSEAEMCGNGIRCFAKYIYENGILENKEMLVETMGGIKKLELDVEGGEVISTKVDMGLATFKTVKIPMISNEEEFLESELLVDGTSIEMSVVSVGNPHAVIFTDDLEEVPLDELGPVIETHPAFPQKINVHFVKILNRNEIEMITWERGVGFTMACGTGATSCVITGFKLDKLDETVLVHLPGGELIIMVYPKEGNLGAIMEGEAILVFDGVMEIRI